MKLIAALALILLAALTATATIGLSSALAEMTTLCNSDPGKGLSEACPSEHVVTHLHETTLNGAKAKLLTSIVNVECDVLFLSDAIEGTSAPLLIEGSFTYTNCSSGCRVEEVSEPSVFEILKEGHETASVTGHAVEEEFAGEVHVNCSGLNCSYNWEGLSATAKGPLLSSETNGSISTSEKELHKVSGLFCPSKTKLDITTTPLSAVYVTN
jgi:hypothetical protein